MLRISTALKLMFIMVFMITVCGCIQDKIVVKLNPDGSGTIEETITAHMFMDKLKKECDKDCPAEDQIAEKMAQETMELASENATEFGQGVKLISVKPVRTDKTAGSIAVYSFDNINKVNINKDPMSRTGGFMKSRGSNDQRIGFSFKKGSPAELTITMFPVEWLDRQIDHDEAESDDDFLDKIDPEVDELLRPGKMYVGLEINGDILKNNATYQAGKSITLIDISFESILGKDSVLKKIQNKHPRSTKQYKEMIQGAKDFKLEMTNPVIIEFK